jgi:ATP-binding cassette subfamily C (CFTR/MRP) protein 1/ATP-binding cassette subfamily C (CFTR/MRP) protein 2
MLKFLAENSNEPDFNGHMYALAMGLAGLFSSIAIHQQYARCNLVGVKVKAAVMGLVYRKSLRLSRVKGGAGQVINLLTSEVNKINDAVLNFHFLWGAFVEVVLILCLSFYEIGISALPAVGFVLILLPLQMYLGKRTDTLGRGQALKTTERVHLMSEILTAIKLIKFYAWEAPFSKNIAQFRVEEMQFIYDGLINKVVNYTVVFSVPVLVSLSCLSLYVSLGNPLTASVSFTVLSVFNTLRYPFFMLPMAVKSTVGGYAAMDRLDAFFKQEEIVELKQSKPEEGNDLAFEMNNCDFKWDGTDGAEPTIRNVSVKIKKGSKVAIFGETGSGKSSILAALLGQIRQTKGNTVKVYGSTAYMSQEAWLLNMTLRDNILFGKPLEVQRYKKVIRVAGLQRDLTLLVAGDQTEIAERGVNLSGGQRQRVSLARAVYYDADIVLLDDPLSAVDSHVGRHIFDECFMKLLKEKTLVLVLNQLNYLSQMDHIIFVQDGKIVDQGTYKDLMETNEHFAKLINSHVDDEIKDEIQEDEENEEEPMNSPDFDPIEVISPESLVDPKIMAEFNNMSVFSHNQLSVRKNSKINENTIRSMIEKQNTTSIYGAERSHDVSGIMAQNEVSRFSVIGVVNQQSMDDFDGIISKNDPELIKLGKIVQEDDSTKTTGFADFVAYARSGSGVFDTIATIIFFALVHTIRIGGDFWLRLWVPRIGDYTDAVYIGVYGAFTALFAIGAFTRGYLFTRITMAKARSLHEKLFDATIHAPMAFFDQTPIARLLSSFSKHQGHVDDTMLDAAIQAFQYLPLGLGAFLLSAILIEWNWIPCFIILGFGYLTLKYSNPADLKIKSLEAVTKPPIYSHLTATLEGLMSIRSYHAEHRFDELNLEKLDRNHEALFAMQNGN